MFIFIFNSLHTKTRVFILGFTDWRLCILGWLLLFCFSRCVCIVASRPTRVVLFFSSCFSSSSSCFLSYSSSTSQFSFSCALHHRHSLDHFVLFLLRFDVAAVGMVHLSIASPTTSSGAAVSKFWTTVTGTVGWVAIDCILAAWQERRKISHKMWIQ